MQTKGKVFYGTEQEVDRRREEANKLFGTKKDLQEFTGYGTQTVEILWNGLKRGAIEDQEIIEAVECDEIPEIRGL